MNRHLTTHLILVRAFLFTTLFFTMACVSSHDPEDVEDTPWQQVAELEYQREGFDLMTPAIEIPGGGAGFALFVETDSCAELAYLADAETIWVSDEGGFSEQEVRFSPIAGRGMFVHAPEQKTDGDATLRIRQLTCETMTPSFDEANTGQLRIWVRPLPEQVDGPVQLPLVLHHGAFSTFSDHSAELVSAINDLMRPAGIEVDLVASTQDDLPTRLAWSEGMPQEFEALAPVWDPRVDIFFAGCVERLHPVTGRRTVLDGVVPRVPGVGAAGGGVFLRGRECGAGESAAIH